MSRCPGVPIVVNWLIFMDLILCKNVDDLKGTCTCTTYLRENLHEATWLATVVASSIHSCPVLTRDKSCVVFYSSFIFSKGVSYALFVLASYSTPTIFIGWQFMVTPNPTFCVDQNTQCRCGNDGILIASHIISVPKFLQQETATILVGAYKETHFPHLVNMKLLFLILRLVSSHFDELTAP